MSTQPIIQVGEAVQIIGNLPPREFTDGNSPIMGTVEKIDGEIVMVRTHFGGHVFEHYRNELRSLDEMTKEDWTRYAVRRHGANGNMGKMAESRGDSLRGWPNKFNEKPELPKKPKPIRIQIRKIHQIKPPSKFMRKIRKLDQMIKARNTKIDDTVQMIAADFADVMERIAAKK